MHTILRGITKAYLPADLNEKWEFEEVDDEVLARVNNNLDAPGDAPPELDYIQ